MIDSKAINRSFPGISGPSFWPRHAVAITDGILTFPGARLSLQYGFTVLEKLLALIFSAVAILFAQGSQPGMGSIPFPGGVAFRVWAPHATTVTVEGDFNNWSTAANPLVSEGDCNWSNDVDGAVAGQSYRYVISSPGFATVTRRDPNCREVTEADYNNGNSIIYDTTAYQWQSPPFTAPPSPTW